MRTETYAIAEIAGDQIILEPGKKISVPKLEVEAGSTFIADKVLYLRNGDKIQIGKPYIKDAAIETTVVEQKRAPKVIVFKKKRRKGYKVKRGHRQHYTVLQVANFGGQPEPKAEHKTEPESKAETTGKKTTKK